MKFGFSPSRAAWGYIALSVLALALFAIPLWYGFRANQGTFRAYVPGEEMQRLADIFQRDGATAMARAIEAQARSLPRDQVVLFAAPSKELLAGNLPAWPPEVPDAPGAYGLVISIGGGESMRVVASHVRLPGGYHLLMGRESVRFESLVARFWYGIAGAVAIILALGAAFAWLLRRAHGELEGLVARRTAQLGESEERYARAMDAAEAGHWEWNVARGEYFVSARQREMLQLPADLHFASREQYLAHIPFHPDDRRPYSEASERHIRNAVPRFEQEYRVVLRGGEIRWMRLRGKSTLDAQGRPTHFSGSLIDITERKKAEEELRGSEERYARAMEGSDAGVWEWNPASDEMFISARARQLFGIRDGVPVRTRSELKLHGGFHPEDRPRIESAIQNCFERRSEGFEIEYRVIHPGGETRWVRSRGKVFADARGGAGLITGSLIDITERKLAADAQRESEQRYERAMLAAEAGFWDWDVVADEYHASSKLLEMAGFAPGTTFSSRADHMQRAPFHPEDRDKWQRAVKELFAGTGQRLSMELRVIVNGQTRWQSLSGICVRDATGKVVRWTGSSTDVTERKRAEEALRESEKRHERAMLAAEAGFWDWDVPADEFYVSPKLLEMTDFAPGTRFAGRADFMTRAPFHPDDRTKWERAVKELFASGGTRLAMEIRSIHGGETRWALLSGMCVREAAGKVLRWTGSATDITARKRAEMALRQSEERYARVMQASEDGFWEWVVASDEFYASPRMLAIYGLPPDTVFRGRADFLSRFPFHPEDLGLWRNAVAAHLAGETARIDIEVRAKLQSETRWIHLTAICLRDASGAEERWTGSVSDVTERRRAQEALRLSEERYARAMEGSGAGHWDWNIVSDEMFVSERAREMLALPAGALPARRSDIMALAPMHPDDRAAMSEAVNAGIQSGIHERDYRLIPRPGEVRWLRARAKVYKDARGAAVRMTGSLIDITERKLAADALRASEQRYSLAMDASEEGHFDTDLETGEMFISARLNEIYGFPRHARIANRVEFLNQIPLHPDDRHLLADIIRPDWEDPTRDLYEFECRIVPRPGEMRWIHTRGKVIRDAEGRARRRVGVVADITERKLAAEELRRSEARFRGLTELWSDWYWEQDESLRFTYSSAAINPPDGYPGGSSIGKTRWELPGIVPLSSSWAEHQAVLAARKPFRDFEYSRPAGDGTLRYISTSGTPIFDEQGNFKGYQGTGRNITERKRIEEELRESEARFRDLTALSSDWYWEQDESLRFTYLSSQAEQLTGYSGESSLGKTRWEIANMTPLTCSWAEHRAVLAAREPFRDLECRRVGPDGTVRYLSMSGAPIFDAQGRFSGYRGIGRNITARKLAAEAVRESEARFRSLTELSSDWYWEQDENMRFTYTSRQLTETTAYPSEWVIGKTRWELPGLTPLSFTWPEHQAALAARQPFRDLEYARTGLDGMRYVSISGAPIFDDAGVFRGYQGVGRDITERKRIEEELRSRQEMLELAQKSARAIAFEWRIGADGPDRNRWSPELAAMYGLGPESYDGSFEQWKQLIHPEDWPAVREAIKHAQRTGEVSAEYRAVHPDASVHWLHARGRMFFDAAGTAVRMVGFMHDVTERRRAEEELKAMERKLRQAQRLEAMGTLAGGIAHDFNNILGAILGYGEMALRDAPKGSRLRRDLDSIVTAGERGRALVDRVLAFSRSGVGERVPVHVEKVVREALDLVSAKLPPDVTLHAKLHAGRAAMLGDATQVHQVLMNLASNAIQAMPSGGTLRVSLGTVRVETPRAPTIGIVDEGDYLVLDVADTGTGIPPDILDRIFDPFFTTKEVGTGTGLGLSLVHGIVAEVGGAINVASKPGAGSMFTVFLPRSGDASDYSQEEEPELPRGDGQRVLVVDDEEPLVKLATRTLEDLGYAPVGFTSSSAALAAFRADPQRFDALITDERMPGMSGSALIREVRGIRDRIPVVLMSGFVGGAVASRAREAGAEEVLKKPLSARDLAASLARVLHS